MSTWKGHSFLNRRVGSARDLSYTAYLPSSLSSFYFTCYTQTYPQESHKPTSEKTTMSRKTTDKAVEVSETEKSRNVCQVLLGVDSKLPEKCDSPAGTIKSIAEMISSEEDLIAIMECEVESEMSFHLELHETDVLSDNEVWSVDEKTGISRTIIYHERGISAP